MGLTGGYKYNILAGYPASLGFSPSFPSYLLTSIRPYVAPTLRPSLPLSSLRHPQSLPPSLPRPYSLLHPLSILTYSLPLPPSSQRPSFQLPYSYLSPTSYLPCPLLPLSSLPPSSHLPPFQLPSSSLTPTFLLLPSLPVFPKTGLPGWVLVRGMK